MKLRIFGAALAAAALILAGLGLGSAWQNRQRLSDLTEQLSTLERKVQPAEAFPPANSGAVVISKAADDLPEPVNRASPQHVVLELEAVEVDGQLADGTTYTYWTFNGTVPGPMLRVRVGDTVELRLKNREDSHNVHSIDLHAVNGPGGGAASTSVAPGEAKTFTFQALNPGVFIYHCASPHLPTHIAQGMYGLIVVEPEGGLPPVDREFYVVQGEVYAAGRPGTGGHQPYDGDKLRREAPDYVVFNGAFQALTGDRALKARVGERIRIFVGNGGPNLTSSFHLIGEVFDTVHPMGAAEPVSHIGTTIIPAGGAAWVEFTVEVPGRYTLVDHAISRAIDKGAVAHLDVEGDPNPAIYQDPGGHPMPEASGH